MTEGKNPFTKKEGPDRENATDLVPDQDGVYKVPGDIKKPTEVEDHKIYPEPQQDNPVPRWTYYETEPAAKPASATDESVSVEPKESTKDATVKATKKPRNAKAEEWKLPEYERMLNEQTGHALNKSIEKVKEGDVSSVKSRKVIYGAARDGLLNKQQSDFEQIKEEFNKNETQTKDEKPETLRQSETPEERYRKAKEMAMKRQAERGASAENLQEFREVYDEWKEARTNSDKLEKEFNVKYEEFLAHESKGWRKWANLPRRIVGLKPKMTDEIRTLYEQSEKARNTYFEKAVRLKDTKQGGTYGESQKVVERYQRLLAHKLVVGVHDRRLAIQEKIALEARKNSQIRPVLEQWRKYRSVKWVATALGYAVIGGATGGVGAAVLASGAYGSRVVSAMILGGAAGSVQRYFGAREEKRALKDLSNSQDQVKGDFFSRGFAAAEKEIEKRHEDLEDMRYWKKASAVAVAASFGAYGASVGDDFFDTGGTPPVPEAKLSPAPHAPSGTNPPPWEGSTTNTPKVELPNEALKPEPSSAAEFVGDMKVSEAMQPKVEEALIGLPNEDLTPPSELIDAKMHTVIKGDNVWNIMEGKGPDANPIGGKSDVLKGMTQFEREDALNKLLAYSDQHPEFGRDIGALKSGGDLNRIYPGESINVSMLDDKLRELLGMENTADNISRVSTPETPNGTPLEEVEPHEPIETDVPGPDEFPEHGPVSVQGKDGVYVVEGRTADVNSMTIHDALNLYQGVRVDDPNALGLLEEMSTDKESFAGVIKFMMTHGDAQSHNSNMLVGDYLNTYKDMPYNSLVESIPAANDNVPDVTPYGLDQPITNPDTVVREASVSGTEVVGGQSLDSYVRSVEQPKNGFLENLIGLGKPNVAGTFDQMANLTIGDIKAMDVNGELPKGVSETGFDVWSKEVAAAAANDNDKTLVEYVSGLANSRVA